MVIQFVGGGDPSDRAAAHPPGPEGDALVESVFKFSPSFQGTEILKGGDRLDRQGAGTKPIPRISEAGGGNSTLRLGCLKGGKNSGGSAHVSSDDYPPAGGDKHGAGGGGG